MTSGTQATQHLLVLGNGINSNNICNCQEENATFYLVSFQVCMHESQNSMYVCMYLHVCIYVCM